MNTTPKVSLLGKRALISLGLFLFFVIFITYFSSNGLTKKVSISVPENSTSTYPYLQEEKYLSVDVNSKIPDVPIISLPHLKIPAIGVDSFIGRVGLTSLGAMDAPKGPTGVVLFDLGPNPGEVGSAVIAGHYGWKDGTPAVFDNLNKLKKGDKIYVDNENGGTSTFVVKEIVLYGENDDASKVFSSKDGKSHLNLITCGGVYNKLKKSYSNRLVVFSDKE